MSLTTSYGTARYHTMVVPIAIHTSAILSVHMYTPALTLLRVACYTSKPIAYKLVYLITAIPLSEVGGSLLRLR